MNPIKPIRSEADYRQALARVEAIFEATPGSPEFDELDILGTLICAYEEKHYPVATPVTAESSAAVAEVWVFHGAGALPAAFSLPKCRPKPSSINTA